MRILNNGKLSKLKRKHILLKQNTTSLDMINISGRDSLVVYVFVVLNTVSLMIHILKVTPLLYYMIILDKTDFQLFYRFIQKSRNLYDRLKS